MSDGRISRRTVLKGLGTAVALPWFESLNFAQDRPAPVLRMAFLYYPNGVNMEAWTPKEEGTLGGLAPTLEPLTPLKDHLLVLSGLSHAKANANGDGPGDHARAAATFLTGCQARKTDGKDLRAGVSVDQLAARHVGACTRLPSLELGCEQGAMAGNCDSGYSCAYTSNISWRTPNAPAGKLVSPRQVFERMFGDPEAAMDDRERARRAAETRSILDFVLEDARALRRRLGTADRGKLDDYMDSVRAMERQIQADEAEAKKIPKMDLPRRPPEEFPKHVRLMLDLMALAFQTDTTRIVTLMFSNEGSERTFPFLEVRDGHHSLSHHGGAKEKLEKIARIDRFHIEQFAYLLSKLAAMREGERSVLDNSMIVYGSGLGDGNAHNHDNLPVLLAGRGGGTILPGRHLRYRRGTPMCNLYLSLLDRLGVRLAGFGDSTGRLEKLEG